MVAIASMPKISVLLPAYNAAATLQAALRSLQRQSEPDWECLVVDDGSSDATLAIASACAERDARIRVIRQQHSGIVAALERGRRSCRAPLIARMDADDLMQRRRLELQTALLARAPQLAGVGGHVRIFPRKSMSDGMRAYESWLGSLRSPDDVRRDRFIECPLVHPALMMRAEVLHAFGYRERPWPEDYDLLLRVLESGLALGVVPQRLLHWRDGHQRLSRSSPRYGLPAFIACKAEFLSQGFLAHAPRYLLWGYGDTAKALAQALERCGKEPSAIIELHPGRLGQLIRGVRVVPPQALSRLRGEPLVVSVAGAGPRAEIRAALAGFGFRELEHYVCAA
jgi:GT2 family glycosyltransferase